MTVLVGYTNTPHGRAALDSGIDLASKGDRKLLVVNASREAGRSDSHRLDQAEVASLRERLSRAEVDAEILVLTSEYDASEQILEAAAEHSAEVIVLGTRKRTPIGKFLLGSTVQRVILDAECAVLCVKAEHPVSV